MQAHCHHNIADVLKRHRHMQHVQKPVFLTTTASLCLFVLQLQSPHSQLQMSCRAPNFLLSFSPHLKAELLSHLALQHSVAQLSFLHVREGVNRGAKVVMEPEKPAPTTRLTRTQMTGTKLSLQQTVMFCTVHVLFIVSF